MPVNFKAVGQRIKEARIVKRMSQADLAERVDVSVNYISLIETAKRRVSLEVLVETANALEVTVDNLLSGNLTSDTAECYSDMIRLIKDCTSYEKQTIHDVATATKKILRTNSWMQHREDCF